MLAADGEYEGTTREPALVGLGGAGGGTTGLAALVACTTGTDLLGSFVTGFPAG